MSKHRKPEVHNELPNFGQGENVSRIFELMRKNQAPIRDKVRGNLAEIVRLFPGIRLGQSPLWVERAVRMKSSPRVLTEVFPLGHTDYFIHWDKRTYSWYFCAEVGFGSIVPLGSVQRRLYRKHEAIEAFFYIWWRKFRIENEQDGFCECPFQPLVYVEGVDAKAILDEVWPLVSDGRQDMRSTERLRMVEINLPDRFETGTEFADVNGVPVTFRPGDAFPLRWNEAEAVPFNISLLVSDGVPLSEEDFRLLVIKLRTSK